MQRTLQPRRARKMALMAMLGVGMGIVRPFDRGEAQQALRAEAIIGRWNLRLLGVPDVHSSWLEIERSGYIALVGRFVGLIGGARPIGRVDWRQGVARFTIPTEWEQPGELSIEARPVGDSLTGTLIRPDGSTIAFVGKRAPLLLHEPPAVWGPPVPLFNGKDLSGWTPAPTARSLPNYWIVRDSTLVNTANEGVNLMTVQRFRDFKLHADYRLTSRNTSGIFPRGRYWVILSNAPDSVPSRNTPGAVHRFLIPSENAKLGPDVWQSIDITLVGRRITVVVNGKTVIANQIIPGPTGSAIDSDEGSPGPIMLQGEEFKVEFRNITISEPLAGRSESSSPSCANADSAAAVSAVRSRLAEWVRQANGNDLAGANEVWAPGVVGWFPRAGIFADSAAFTAAKVKKSPGSPNLSTTVELSIADIVASGPLVVVHDIWTETKTFAGATSRAVRTIRSSELWRCQPDGRWRIVRWVSAPEPWTTRGR